MVHSSTSHLLFLSHIKRWKGEERVQQDNDVKELKTNKETSNSTYPSISIEKKEGPKKKELKVPRIPQLRSSGASRYHVHVHYFQNHHVKIRR